MNSKIDLETLKCEQERELFEAIRHFCKYKAIGKLYPDLAMPVRGEFIEKALTELYEDKFENER